MRTPSFIPTSLKPVLVACRGRALLSATIFGLCAWSGTAQTTTSARGTNALFVYAGATMNANDRAVSNRLVTLGYRVTAVLATASATAQAATNDLIVVSSTVSSGDMLSGGIHKFLNSAVPIINWENGNYDDLRMTSTAGGQFGTAGSQTSVRIVRANHPLAGELPLGTNVIYNSAQTIAYGIPLPNAIVIARQVGDDSRGVLFAYERGDILFGGVIAAERRIGMPLDNTFGAANTNGVALFDAAVRWANPVNPAPVLLSEPADATVVEARPVTFACEANGARPFLFQWSKNNTAIAGATNRNYTATPALSDNGAVYSVKVSNASGSVTSRSAKVTVTEDKTPPTIVSVVGSASMTEVTVNFSEPVLQATATNLPNYAFVPAVLSVRSAKLSADGSSVVLTTTPQSPGASYALRVSGVRDSSAALNLIAPGTEVNFSGWVLSRGSLLFEVFNDVGAPPALTAVSNLTATAKFINNTPDFTGYLTAFDTRTIYPTDINELYGARISGLFTAPSNGLYRFFIRSDDGSQLFMNTNSVNSTDASKKVLICKEDDCCDPFGDASGGPTVSPDIQLVGGQRYYIEALLKEGTGGDYVQVALREKAVAGSPPSSPPESIPGVLLSAFANPDGAAITISEQPQSLTVGEGSGAAATFKVTATAKTLTSTNQSIAYQWQRNGVDIAGANASSYSVPAAPSNAGKYRVLMMIPGKELMSAEATLTVTPDAAAPTLVSANTYTRQDKMTVVFSEPVSDATATKSSNYTLNNGVNVVSATRTSPNTVELGVSTAPPVAPAPPPPPPPPPASTLPASTLTPVSPLTLTEFDFNEGTGTNVTSRDGRLSGAFVGTPNFTNDTPSGLAGDSSLRFGPGQRVTVPDPTKVLALTTNDPSFTIQAWLKIATQTNSRSVFFYNNGPGGAVSASITSTNAAGVGGGSGVQSYRASLTTLGIADFNVTYVNKAGIPNDNNWHHMAVVHDFAKKEVRYYIDGTLGDTVTNYTRGVIFTRTNQVFYLGSEPTGGLQYQGMVDRFRYSKGVLALDQLDSRPNPSGPAVQTLISINPTQLWRYSNTGATNLGTAWKERSYDDSAWPQGAALLALESGVTIEPIRTQLKRTNSLGGNIVTDYFRTHFTFTGDPKTAALKVRYVVDDGLVLYLNGTEVHRYLVAAGAVTPSTGVTAGHEGRDRYEGPFDIPVTALVAGDNVLAAEVHQDGATSSDVVFGLELKATIGAAAAPPPPPPSATLTNLLVSFSNTNQLWRYENTGQTNLGAAWKERTFNDSAWPQGPAILAFESGATTEPIRTQLKRTNSVGAQIMTDYFRTHFNYTGDPKTAQLKVRHYVDDGFVLYLNGTEVYRFGIATGAVTPTTPATSHEGRNLLEGPFEIPAAALVTGDNVLAAEVHQTDPGSSDIVFGLELSALSAAAPAPPPAALTNLLVSFSNTNQLWRYENTGQTNLGAAWKEKAFNDSAWPQGPTILAFESGATTEPIRTQLKRTNSVGAQIMTDYFRTHFNYAGDPKTVQLKVRHYVDDGFVLYLNGTEVYRFGIAAGAVTPTTAATSHEGRNLLEGPFDLPAAALVTGDNVLAAEVHQTDPGSSDIVFGLELVATTSTGTTTTAPSVQLQATAPLAYEGFNYASGDLPGRAGGTGWAAPWQVNNSPANSALVQAESLPYTDVRGNRLVTSGGKGYVIGQAGTAQPFREIPSVLTNSGTTVWFSFVGQRVGITTNNSVAAEAANIYPRAANVSLFNSTLASSSEQLAIGNGSGAPTNTWSLLPDGSLANRQGTLASFANVSFVVVRIDFKAGNDDAYLWVNPLLDVEPSIASADAKSLGSFDYSFNRIRPFAGNPQNNRPYAEMVYDELRVGTSYPSVAPFTVGPPPGTPLSIGLNFGADEVNGTSSASLTSSSVAGVPGVAQANWNNLRGQSGTNSTVVADAAGANVATKVRVEWGSNNTWASTGSRGEENNRFPTNSADRVLMTGYLDTGSATTTSVSISGVPSELTSAGYDVYVYLLGGVPNKGGGYRILDAATKSVLRGYVLAQCSANPTNFVAVPSGLPPGQNGTGNYLVFSGLNASGIIIEASTAGGLGFGSTPRAPINAVQLVQSVPYRIGLNFGSSEASASLASADVAGAIPQANWNNLAGRTGTNTTVVAEAAGTSRATAVRVQWASNNTWANIPGASPPAPESGNRTETNNSFPTNSTDRVLMRGYLDTGNTTTTSVTLSDLPPQLTGGRYDVYVYALGGVAARGGAYRVLDAATGQVLRDYVLAQSPANPTDLVQVPILPVPQYGSGDYLVFSGLSSSSIIIEATTVVPFGFGGTSPRAPINAVQLVSPSSAPPPSGPLPTAGLQLTVTGVQDLAEKPNIIAANTRIIVNTDSAAPAEFGQFVNAYQDDFSGTALNPNWKARNQSTNVLYTLSNGMLRVVAGPGDPNHLLYEASGYSSTNQEVLARIRIAAFGTGDPPRAGIAVGVGTNSQGINLHFRDANQTDAGTTVNGRQIRLLDDLRAWGPGYDFRPVGANRWVTNAWYWLRVRQQVDTASGKMDIFGKAWPADGTVPEPSNWQVQWDRYPTATAREGFAGIAAGVNNGLGTFDVDYILIKAAGLSTIKAGGSDISPKQALLVTGTTPSAGDAVVSTVLAGAGYKVTTVTAPASQTSDAAGKDVILVSSTVSSGDMLVGGVHKFRDTAVPLLNWESASYDDLGMTGTASTEFGTSANMAGINIVNPSHPLAGGVPAGTNAVFLSPQTVTWGVPLANAIVVARPVDNAARAVIFGYEQGD
ncbi:MAG: hypothetical protein HY735_18525, partial [Verrucomicrobia bacterium]|nr:hypothetical protein [Verrucomicrobiota bacterium]